MENGDMELQEIVDNIRNMAAIFAFEAYPDGKCSELRLMAANDGFIASLMANPGKPQFYPGIPYKLYFSDVNFEKFVYDSGVLKKPLYAYVNAHMNWITGLYFPIDREEQTEDGTRTLYVCYIMQFSRNPDAQMLSTYPPDVSAEVLSISVNLQKKGDFYISLQEAASNIANVVGSEICSILMVDKNEKICTLVSNKGLHNEYFKVMAADMGRTPYEAAKAWEEDLANSDCLMSDDLSVIAERDLAWYESLKRYSVRSIMLYAIRFNRTLVGFIWAANYNVEKSEHIKMVLELVSFFMSSVIANHQLLNRLETMSLTDLLTEVGNRNAMNKRVDNLISGKSHPLAMGVLFADLNGLKTVNDKHGHDAGDRLLKKTASLLKMVFDSSEIYRAGGDEFVVMCPNMEKDEFEKRIDELKAMAQSTGDVRLAVGSSYYIGDYDICRAMQEADELMYLDKQEYYRLNPDKKRK